MHTFFLLFWRAVFTFASNALDTQMGAINTGVLIFSSLTAAWAVRNAQLGQKTGLIVNLSITILCAFGFMGIKYLEYSHKFHKGLFPGDKYEAKEGAYGDESKGNANTVAFTSGEVHQILFRLPLGLKYDMSAFKLEIVVKGNFSETWDSDPMVSGSPGQL